MARDGDTPEATQAASRCFRTALTVARAQAARMPMLQVLVAWTRCLIPSGQTEELCRKLTAVHAEFDEGFDAPLLREARALLDELQ